MEQNNKIVLFQEKAIRRIWHIEQWYFSVVDVIEILTDSPNPRVYWGVLKGREPQLFTICKQFKMIATDGKNRMTDCTNTEGMLRIIMSIPSPKAEPFKQWLAQVGKERLDEIENPEISIERLTEIYKSKGYDDIWIGNRLKTIGIRRELTEEWQKRGVKESKEYSILTAEIAKATFGITPSEHAKIKGLEKENLRDHMTNLELVFTALGEEITRQLAIKDDAQGFAENHDAAMQGGSFAGNARQRLESEKGIKVVSSENYLNQLNSSTNNPMPLEGGEGVTEGK